MQLSFSGILFGSFQYRTDQAARATNRFELERAYLNFRMPAGDRTSIRVTTDVYQQQRSPEDSYYRGWSVRAKYAYIQHDYLNGKEWTGYARLGMLNTVVIEHIESFWPRWMSQVAIERAGFFSSADLGLSAQLGLPRKLGEVIGVITNGPGYTSRETDRFKDYAARLSLTPMSNATTPLVKSLTLSFWGYKGAIASRFVAGGAGQSGSVNEGLSRDRYGIFAGVRDTRFSLGAEFARREDEGETGANTVLSPRAVQDSTGSVRSAFAMVRPLQLRNPKSTVPLGLIARWDKVSPNTSADPSYDLYISGITWDLSKRTILALDYQVTVPDNGRPVPVNKTLFAHFVASF